MITYCNGMSGRPIVRLTREQAERMYPGEAIYRNGKLIK